MADQFVILISSTVSVATTLNNKLVIVHETRQTLRHASGWASECAACGTTGIRIMQCT